MIIETAKGKFWVDDSAVTEDPVTGALSVDFSKRVRYDRYLIQSQIDALRAQNTELQAQTPNPVLLEWARQNHPARVAIVANLARIEELQAQLANLRVD